jgi:hypothetical protein
MPPVHPIIGKFDQDPRVSFDKTAGKWQYEDDETGQEFEFNEHAKTWLPLVSCLLLSCHWMELHKAETCRSTRTP